MTTHISAKKGEIAPFVIMPGDPKRAKFIAENYLEDYKLVSDVRSICAYTGKYKGKDVTVMASGMGMPSMAIYAYELYDLYDVEKIIRVGTCGSLKENICLNDVLLATSVATDSNIADVFNNGKCVLKYELNDDIKNIASLNNIKLIEANIFTTDIFYREDYDCNFDAVEMETYILMYLASYFNKKSASILTVSDSVITKKALSPEERQNSLEKAIFLALESI